MRGSETERVRVNERTVRVRVKERVCVCWCGSVGERQKKEKTVRGRRKSHDDMPVIYSPAAGLCINIDLLQCRTCVQVIQGLNFSVLFIYCGWNMCISIFSHDQHINTAVPEYVSHVFSCLPAPVACNVVQHAQRKVAHVCPGQAKRLWVSHWADSWYVLPPSSWLFSLWFMLKASFCVLNSFATTGDF